MIDYEIGRLSSGPLTEIRTVLSRAETALGVLLRARGRFSELELEPAEGHHEPDGLPQPSRYAGRMWQNTKWVVDKPAIRIPHPDLDEMCDALQTAISAMKKWERTGAPKRRKP